MNKHLIFIKYLHVVKKNQIHKIAYTKKQQSSFSKLPTPTPQQLPSCLGITFLPVGKTLLSLNVSNFRQFADFLL